MDLLEDFKNLRDVFLPLNRASGISRWQCECQKQIGTGHNQLFAAGKHDELAYADEQTDEYSLMKYVAR